MSNASKLFVLLFTIILFGCKDDDPTIESTIIGTWQLSEIVKDNAPVALDDCKKESLIQFQSNKMLRKYDGCTEQISRAGWSYKGDMINISTDLPAAYLPEVSTNTLTLTRKDFSTTGSIVVTQMIYKAVQGSDFPQEKK